MAQVEVGIPIGYDIFVSPMPLIDNYGNIIVIMSSNDSTYTMIGTFVVTKGGGMGGNSHYAMSGVELKRATFLEL